MSVITKTTEKRPEDIEDDISKETVDSGVDQDKLSELKAKMAAKITKKEDDVPPRIVEKKKRSLNFGVVGTGQAGSRIAEAFYKLGYTAVAFNTAPQDLEQIDLPEDNKYLLEYGIGGAAKDVDIGHAAAETHRNGISNVVADSLGDAQVFLLCLSLGGGSGAGSHDVMIDVLTETGRPIVVITVLPMSTEDAQTKQNALNTLSKLASLAQSKVISNLIVVDNAKLEAIYSDVSHMNFFSVGNQAIVKTIDVFNNFSSRASQEKSLDPMEWAKLFTDGEGLCVYGEVHVPNYADDNTAIAEAVLENHENGLLASGFNLGHAKYAGALIVANTKAWEKIPRGSVDYAMSLIQENCPGAEGVFRGTYVDDTIEEDVVYVFSMFSGLGLPDNRVTQLRKEVEAEKSKTQERVKSRSTNLTLDTGTEKTVSKAEEVRQKIAKNKSTFAQNFAQGKPFDFRKR
jgi:cell division GTPase FtsZ